MPRPPVKKTMKLAQAQEEGKIRAQFKMEKKKPFEISLKEHIGKFIDRLTVDDGLKLAAVMGITYIIKPIIQVAPDIIAKANSLGEMFSLMGFAEPFIRLWKGPGPLIEWAKGKAAPWVVSNALSEPAAWLLSFCVACLIVIFGPALLESMGSVVKIAGLLLTV